MEILLNNISKSYIMGNRSVEVLKKINLHVNEGEFVTIFGSSGSGKTTLMNLIGGLDNLDSGEIIVNGKNISHLSERELSKYRRRQVGYIFQMFNLIPMLTAYENIIYPILIDKKRVEKFYIEEVMKDLGIQEKRDAFPNELSGGQQQRVAIARALANKPDIILADEPTGNLDEKTGEMVLECLMSGIKKYKRTLIMITHSPEIARKSDRICTLREGELHEDNDKIIL